MPHNQYHKGMVSGCLSAVAFFLMTIISQRLSNTIPSTQLSTYRGLITAVLLSPFIFSKLHVITNLRTSHSAWLRSLFGAAAVCCFFINLQYTSAASAKALSNTSPIFVLIFAAATLKQKIDHKELASSGLIALGSVILAGILSNADGWQQTTIGVIGAIFTALAYITLKEATRKHSSNEIVFCFGICVAIVSWMVSSNWRTPTPTQYLTIFSIGLLGTVGQVLLTMSYKYLSNTTATALTLLQSVALVGYDIAMSSFHGPLEILANTVILIGVLITTTPVKMRKSTTLEILKPDP